MILEITKKVTSLQVINNPIIRKFFNDFTNHEIRLTGWQFSAKDLSLTFLNTGTTNENVQCRRQHLQSIKQRRYSRFAFVQNTVSHSPKVPTAKFLGRNTFFCFSSICKFGSFKNPFVAITGLSKIYFRFRGFILLVKMKKVISVNYGSSTNC